MPATSGYHTPFMGSVLANSVNAQSIYTLLQAFWSDLPIRASYVQIQLDTTAGSTFLYIGNSNVSSTMCGANLSANQANQQYAFDSNLIALNDLWIICSTGEVRVNLIVMVR
jgi:hypothetical protein